MAMKRIYKIFILGCLALMASEVKAQDKKDLFNPVNYAVISQTIAPDARGGGLGDIGAATDPDVNSQYWNPAKYPFTISRAGVSLSFTPWLRSLVNDMNLAYLSGYFLQLFLETARGIAETLEDTADARNIIIFTMHTVFIF